MRKIEGDYTFHTDAEYVSFRLLSRLAEEQSIDFKVPILDETGSCYKGTLTLLTWPIVQLERSDDLSLLDIRTAARYFSQPVAVTMQMSVPSEIAPATVSLTHWRSGIIMVPEDSWCFNGQECTRWRTDHGMVHAVLANSFQQFQNSFGFKWSRAGTRFSSES